MRSPLPHLDQGGGAVSAPNPNAVIPPPRPPLPASLVSGKRLPYGVTALAVAGLALLLAFASLAFAWRAIDQANDARQIALAGRGEPDAPSTVGAQAPQSEPAAVESTDPVEPTEPAGTGEPAPLDERTVYTSKYEKQILTLKASGCNRPMYADLDEPRANVGAGGYDLALHAGCASSYLALGDGVAGSESASVASTPQDCAEQIRTAPLGEATVPVRKGVVLCLTTSFAAANERGDDQRMVLVEITGVADDEAVTLKTTAWNIPR
jgi:hypothetical protein